MRVDPDGERLDEFLHVYTETMKRPRRSNYLFSREFFESLLRGLRAGGTVHVVHDGKVVSSELVMLSQRHASFFLGGTLAESFDLRPNDLLQVETLQWCRNAGKKSLVLGGGYKGSEGLGKGKRCFAPGGEGLFPRRDEGPRSCPLRAVSWGAAAGAGARRQMESRNRSPLPVSGRRYKRHMHDVGLLLTLTRG